MATNTSQPIPGVRENRESSGGEDDSEEILDPRVKVWYSVMVVIFTETLDKLRGLKSTANFLDLRIQE